MPYKNIEDRRKNHNAIIAKKRAFSLRVRRLSKCKLCGFDDHRALVFHHRDPSTKNDYIQRMVSGTRSMKTLKDEMRKCDIVCANCHHILHA